MTSVFLLGWKRWELRWQTGQNATKCYVKIKPAPLIVPLTSTKNKLFLLPCVLVAGFVNMQHTLSIMVEPLPLLTLQCCWCMKLHSTRSLCGLKTKGGTPHEKVWKGSDTKMTALVISMDLRFFTQNLFLYLHRNICSAKQRENQR